MSFALGLSAGIGLVSVMPSLGLAYVFCALLSLLILINLALAKCGVASARAAGRVGRGPLVFLLSMLAGCIYGTAFGERLQAAQLPPQWELRDIRLEARVSSLPRLQHSQRGEYWRFDVAVINSDCSGQDAAGAASAEPLQWQPCNFSLKKLRLSWYEAETRPALGQMYRWTVRLRRPRGFASAGAFDYGAWLSREGYQASGYIRDASLGESIGDSIWQQAQTVGQETPNWREGLYQKLEKATVGLDSAPVLKALAMGERGAISAMQWQRFVDTGTVHLMAISGLHIGIAASLGWLLGALIQRPLLLLTGRTMGPCLAKAQQPWPLNTAVLISLISAAGYAAVAGFSLPTQRALIMAVVALLPLYFARAQAPLRSLSFALAGVLLIDPLALHSPGFYMSFLAVAALMLGFYQRGRVRVLSASATAGSNAAGKPGISAWSSRWTSWRQWWAPQLIVLLALVPVLAWLQQSLPLWSVLANLICVPLFSLLIVPMVLVALALLGLGFNSPLWGWADWLLRWVDSGLAVLADSSLAALTVSLSPVALGLAALACLLCLLPVGRWRWLACFALLPLMFKPMTRPAEGEFWLSVLDVGQGLSVVVQTHEQDLVYDLGPTYGDSFSASNAVVLPWLRRYGISDLSALVISHGDADHRGDLSGFLGHIPTARRYYGERMPELTEDKPLGTGKTGPGDSPWQRCHSAQAWQNSGVSFRFLDSGISGLSGGAIAQAASSNRQSCVLYIRGPFGWALLPGDIGRLAEVQLQWPAKHPGVAAPGLVLAAHHGSRTSSAVDFIAAAGASDVVYSAAIKHRFGHPHAEVVRRWREAGARGWSTAVHGSLQFRFSARGLQRIPTRRSSRFYWQSV